MADSVSQRFERAVWRAEDALIAAKELLPKEFYRSPPSWMGYVLLIPGLLLISFLFIGMFILGFYSFLTYDPIEFIIYEFTLENWERLLGTAGYYRTFIRTILFALLITTVSVALAIPYAYLTIRVRSSLARKLLLISLFVPFFTGVIVRAYGWLIILGRNGLVNTFLGLFGVEPIRFIGTQFGVAVGLLQIMLPFAIIMIAPAVQNIDRSLELAASNLGANRLSTFRHIVIPLSMPGIAGATIVVFTITSATYAIPALIGGGQVDFVANLIYRMLFDLSNWPLAATFSITLVLVSSIVVLFVFQVIGTGTLGVDTGDDDE